MTLEYLGDAYRTLKRTRTRTLLTSLGIAIGVASVTCILAISDGARQATTNQIDDFDGKLIVVRPGVYSREFSDYFNIADQQQYNTSTLTDADVSEAKTIEHAVAVAPLMSLSATAKAGDKSTPNTTVLATTPDFIKTADLEMSAGQFFNEENSDSAAVIGTELSIKLFNTNRSVGQVFSMFGKEFTVIGVVKNSANPINYNKINYGDAAFISYDEGKVLREGSVQIQQINILADDKSRAQTVSEELKDKISKKHLGENDFSVLMDSEISRPTSELFSAMIAVMTSIAAISLVVGGIGVMNIMLVGVAERTREIGIRKAVGASQGVIIGQFLIESLMLGLLGSVAGYILGYVMAFTIGSQLYFSPIFTWSTALIAALMSIGVGAIFGTYPALKAARKNTIESLRQYH